MLHYNILFTFTADNGVGPTMQLDDLNGQQNGTFQSPPAPFSMTQMIYSPPAQVDPQVQHVPNQQTTAQGPHENYMQGSTPLHQGAYQQTTGHLHPGVCQQPASHLHNGLYQAQSVSESVSYRRSNFS